MNLETQQNVLTTPTGYEILRQIYTTDDPYTTKIAEKIGSTLPSVNNYIRGLKKLGLIQVDREDGRKKIYSISMEGLWNVWVNIWHENIPEKDKEVLSDDFIGRKTVYKHKDRFKNVFQEYIDFYLGTSEKKEEGIQDTTIRKMLLDDFYTGLFLAVRGFPGPEFSLDLPDWVRDVEAELSFLYRIKKEKRTTPMTGSLYSLFGAD